MQHHRSVRVIKKNQKAEEASPAKATSEATTERELKSVVSGWIREHRQRSEEYRRSFADLLKETGFCSPRARSLA